MRHDVRKVVTAARLEVDVVDRVGECAGRADVFACEVEVTGRRFDPRGEQQRGGPPLVWGCVAGGVECGQNSLCASAVAEDDPCPTEPVDDVEREERIVRGAPNQCRVDIGALGSGEGEKFGLAAAAHTLCRGSGCVSKPGGVRGECAFVQPGVGHCFQRERANALEQPVSNRCRGVVIVDDHERTAREATDYVDRRRQRGRRALRGRIRRRAAEHHRRRRRAPTGRACRRGTTARNSTGSWPSVPAAVPAGGWSDRSAR